MVRTLPGVRPRRGGGIGAPGHRPPKRSHTATRAQRAARSAARARAKATDPRQTRVTAHTAPQGASQAGGTGIGDGAATQVRVRRAAGGALPGTPGRAAPGVRGAASSRPRGAAPCGSPRPPRNGRQHFSHEPMVASRPAWRRARRPRRHLQSSPRWCAPAPAARPRPPRARTHRSALPQSHAAGRRRRRRPKSQV